MYSKIEFLTNDLNYINEVNQFIKDWFSDKDYIISKTSGSTGIPKEIKLKKEYLRASARMTGNFFKFNKNDTLLLSLPIFGIGGKMIIIRAIEFSCKLIVVSPHYNPFKNLKDVKIKIASLVPYQVNKILEEDINTFTNVEHLLIGGAPINENLRYRLKKISSNSYETFGMTETYSHIALKNIKKNNFFELLENIKIKTENDCLVVDAPYLGVEDLITNDIVNIIDEYRFTWIGRKDFIINTGGIKLHPEQIENKIKGCLTQSYFVTKEIDINFGEIVILIIEGVAIAESKIREMISNKLSTYEMPKKIHFIHEFVYTNTHKINRIETLKKRFSIE